MPPKPPHRIPRAPLRSSSKSQASLPSIHPPPRGAKPHPSSQSHRAHPSPPPPPFSSSSSHAAYGAIRTYAGISLFSIALCLFLRDNLVSIDTVIGSSMAPTLSPDGHETGKKDWIIIQRHTRNGRDVKRGDVVTLWKPHKPEEISIKRVIGVEGDTVYPRRGYALESGMVGRRRVEGGWDGLPNRRWDGAWEDRGEEVEEAKVVVPKGHVWIEGDNWRRSYDSCDFGPVSLGLIDGRAVRVWRDWFGGLSGVGDARRVVEKTKVVEQREMPV